MAYLEKDIKRKIFWTSLVITIIIFVIGLLLSYILDFYRMDEITKTIETHEIEKSAYYLEQEFADRMGADKCAVMNQRFYDLKMDMNKVGIALNNYWGKSVITKVDFDYLKRKYFLLELEFYALIQKLNLECDTNYVTILFFYEKDDQNSITQGYVLEDISKSFTDNLVVLSIDKDYEDEPLVPSLVKSYNVTTSPTMIINNFKIDEFQYGGQINATVKEIIRNTSTDKYAKYYDFDYLFNNIGVNKTSYSASMMVLLRDADIGNDSSNDSNNSNDSSNENEINKFNYSNSNSYTLLKAELRFILGRITKNTSMQCEALQYYDQAALETDNEELKASIYETVSAIGCGRNKRAFLELASESWKEAGNINRAEIDHALANNMPLPITFDTSSFVSFVPSPITPIKPAADGSMGSITPQMIVFGRSNYRITDDDIIISQTDRFTRDWLGLQIQSPYSSNILATFSERLTYNESDLRPDIGWHEGGRIKMISKTGASALPATATIVVKKDGKWYAPNENGKFMFEVPLDKVLYPSTRFLRKDIAVIVDTHGINSVVEQAMRHNASIVIGCCDHPAKIKAAKYLSDKGKTVICFPDKFGYLALRSGINLLTSPPVKLIRNTESAGQDAGPEATEQDATELKAIQQDAAEQETIQQDVADLSAGQEDNKYTALIGNQLLRIKISEPVIVMNATNSPYALWYYQTPADYFVQLSSYIKGMKLIFVTVDDFGQMSKVIDAANHNDTHVVAARVFNYDDYSKIKAWLLSSSDNRAILFHSAPYPYGYLILNEFPKQTTFGDVNPEFE